MKLFHRESPFKRPHRVVKKAWRNQDVEDGDWEEEVRRVRGVYG